MAKRRIFFGIILVIALGCTIDLKSQSVPLGMNYQAVARDENGKEITQKSIDVKFTILSGSPVGTEVYQETFSSVLTSKYGVFNLIIGKGDKTNPDGPDISQVPWEQANHWLKVEIDFGTGFINMGTMQFMAVPYAMFAYKSLEAGPIGPQGPPGDPASDQQTLSFDGSILSISNGNQVDLGTLNPPHSLAIVGNKLSILGGNSVDLPNQIQDLTLDVNDNLKITNNPSATTISLTKYLDNTDSQGLIFNSGTNVLSITGGTSADLTPMKQNLTLNGNILTITNITSPTPIDLSRYLQLLSFNTSTYKLSLSGVVGDVDLTVLKNDADSDPTNELQTLTFDKTSENLSISSKNSVSLINTIGFKAKKSVSQSGLLIGTTYPFVNSEVEFNEGPYYDNGTGSFTAPITGIYTFFIYYKADGSGSGRVLSILKNGTVYEVIGPDISSLSELSKWITMKLIQGDNVSLTINTGMSQYSGTGSFVGYRNN